MWSKWRMVIGIQKGNKMSDLEEINNRLKNIQKEQGNLAILIGAIAVLVFFIAHKLNIFFWQ